MSEEREQPSEEELRAALEEQLRKITVTDVLLQTVVTLVNLASRRLGLGGGEQAEEEKDLEQARLAIDAIRALLPLLPEKETEPVKDAVAQLQMAFAREAKGGGPAEEPPPQADESKIWTPPGT